MVGVAIAGADLAGADISGTGLMALVRQASDVEGQVRGDCIDCTRCVTVCPTGVDIRKGLQMGCIGCGLCIDACNDVMTRLDRPKGLIRFDNETSERARSFTAVKIAWWRGKALTFAGAAGIEFQQAVTASVQFGFQAFAFAAGVGHQGIPGLVFAAFEQRLARAGQLAPRDAAAAATILRGALALWGEKSWAGELATRARQQLAEVEKIPRDGDDKKIGTGK